MKFCVDFNSNLRVIRKRECNKENACHGILGAFNSDLEAFNSDPEAINSDLEAFKSLRAKCK